MFKSNVLQNVDNETYMQPQNPTPPPKKNKFLNEKNTICTSSASSNMRFLQQLLHFHFTRYFNYSLFVY